MAFPKRIRQEVRRKANFRCCRCDNIGIEAHHIVPSSEGGTNEFDNAAPLCPNCHSWFGDNPKKRKEIREMRDRWYEVVKEKWPVPDADDERLNESLVADAGSTELIAELLRKTEDLADRLRANPSQEVVREAATGLVTATKLGDRVYANVHCQNCGTSIGLAVGSDACPNCGTPFPS